MVTILETGVGTTIATMTSNQRYDKYKKLLISVSQTYDAKARSSRSRHCATKAFLHQMQDPYESGFDINMDVDMLMAYKTMRSHSDPILEKKVYTSPNQSSPPVSYGYIIW